MAERRGPMGELWALAAVSGLLLFLGGCDPTIRATVENGVITLSQSAFTAFLRALSQIALGT